MPSDKSNSIEKENHMFKKAGLILSIGVLVCVLGAASALASDASGEICTFYNADEGVTVSGYCDGRINAFDIAQPVAIYYSYDTVQAVNDEGNTYLTDVISGIELWSIDADGNGQLALSVPLASITPAFSATSNAQIAAANGLSLNYSPAAHAFWVTAPGYSFSWEAW
jgi:hypothetical protein